jgi:hypothetical protein
MRLSTSCGDYDWPIRSNLVLLTVNGYRCLTAGMKSMTHFFQQCRAADQARHGLLAALRMLALFSLASPLAPLRAADLIPADRLTDWTPGINVGVPGGIPTNRTRIIDVTKPPYNADNTGNQDCGSAFAAALAASSEGDVIYFPAGTFRFNGTFGTGIRVHNRTIRGAGMDVTFIDSRASNAVVSIGTGSNWNYPTSGNTITAGLSKGSTNLTMADTSAFTPGELILIEFENLTDDNLIKDSSTRKGAVPVVSVSGFPNMRRQLTRITGKTSNSLSIFPAIYHAPVPGLSARVTHSYWYTIGMGVEDLTILNKDNTATFAIVFNDCYGSWIKNVKSLNTSNYHVMFNSCLQSEIRGCHFSDRKTGGTNGAGILFGQSAGCLVEDNIVEKVFPLIEVNAGSAGNVFAYNFFDGSGMNINHGPHNSHNLYEGNISPWIQSDGYFGGASEDTIFRNWLTGTYYGTNTYTNIVALNRFTRNYSIIGNIIGTPSWPLNYSGYSFGNPNLGNSSFVGTSQMSAGIFPKDWKMSAVITKRESPTSGEMTLNSGSLRVGQFRSYMSNGGGELVISAVNGKTVTFKSANGLLPTVGTTVTIQAGIEGFQEKDLDVESTTILKANYSMFNYSGGGVGVPQAQSIGSDGLPNSLFRTSRPSYFADDQQWPPFDPTRGNPSPLYDSIPAGRRFVSGTVPPPGGGNQIANQPPASVKIQRL